MAPQTRSMKIRRAGVVESLHDQVPLLPEEIIEEILARLPVKSLLRFRCVSKSWRSLLGSDRFIKIHFEYSKTDKTLAHWRFFCKKFGSKYYKSMMVIRVAGTDVLDVLDVDLFPIDDPINDHHLMKGRVVGVYNGLLCFLKEGCVSLWNPATRFSVELPKIGNNVTFQNYGFGWDEESDAYKVFAVVSSRSRPNKRPVGKVYSSKTNLWKTVEYDTEYFDLECGGCDCDMEYFDLETEEFGRIHTNCTFPNLSLENTQAQMLYSDGCHEICYFVESLVSPQVNGRPKRQRRRPDRYA